MSESRYRIVSEIDPQTSAGANKVKQDLRGIQNEAKATETAINRSFDQQRFERSIGSLLNRLDKIDKGMSTLSAETTKLSRSNDGLASAFDRVAVSGGKAATETERGKVAAAGAAAASGQLDAALRRVLQATDAEAAEQHRLNALLADAKRLLDAGAISQERYAQVQRLASQAGREQVQIGGQQRMGMQQLGYQIGDVATMYSLGARPSQIFASQIGQITQAVQLASGGTSKWAAFLGGPWGIALSTAVILLAPFIGKLWESGDALDESIDKMRKDAAETEVNRKAKEAFAKTLEGVIDGMKRQNEELKKSIQTQRDAAIASATEARQREIDFKKNVADLKERLRIAREAAEVAQELAATSPDPAAAAFGIASALRKVTELEQQLASAEKQAGGFAEAIRRADAALAMNAAKDAVDPIKAINTQYEQLAADAINAAVAQKKSNAELTRTLTLLEKQKKAALEAEQKRQSQKSSSPYGVGVATFRSPQQAIGIAGRELLAGGLKVGENAQFGGVKARHTGAGHREGRAIDVDIAGASDKAATPPDIRAKYDGLARRYAARGYVVLWAGKRYDPSGKITNIPPGEHQHYGHIHLEAPRTIVGKPTQAGAESAARSEENAATKTQERAEDFVQAIADKAATQGLPANRQSQLNAQINEALAEFTRRFDREATAGERASITKALTDADAREIGQRFDEAYVRPLNRLKALQGVVGLDREVLNAKLEETERLGRALTPTEDKMIENAIRQGDALEREAAILADVKGPLQEYAAQIAALNELLAKGEITQNAYNARIAALGREASALVSQLPGVDPKTGMNYSDIAEVNDENARYAQQLADLESHREQLLQLGIDYNAAEAAAYQQHVNNLNAIDAARKDVQLGAAEDIFSSLTSIAENTAGKQSKIYRAMFTVEKAVAIARSIVAIQTGIAQASALPFPANLGAIASVAAATASIVSNIRAVSLNYKDGGRIIGPGGPRSDSVPVNASNGEFMVNADATARNLPLLEAINSGRQVTMARRASAAPAAPTPTMAAPAAPPVNVNMRSINVLDPALIGDFLQTPEGETMFVNMIHRNGEAIRQVSSQ